MRVHQIHTLLTMYEQMWYIKKNESKIQHQKVQIVSMQAGNKKALISRNGLGALDHANQVRSDLRLNQ